MNISEPMTAGHRVASVALLCCAVAALVGLVVAMNSPVRTVRVSGDLSVSERDQVKVAVLNRLDGGMLRVNLDAVVGDVLALTWPRDVQARRSWPGVVDVSVTKDPIVARWGAGGVLNSVGEVIDADDAQEELPLIRCVNASGARAMQIFQMLSQVLVDAPLKVASLEEDALGEWQVKFTNELTVSLGREDLLERVKRFDRVYRDVIAQRAGDADHIDARYANGVAVGWRIDPTGLQLASTTEVNEVVR